MNITWLLGLFLLTPQPANMQGNFPITEHGQPFVGVHCKEFSVSLSRNPMIDAEKLTKCMDEIDKQVSKEPKNATLDQHGNIMPERAGSRLNRDIFTEKVYSYAINNGPANLEIPVVTIYPKVDSELLEGLRNKKIGEYVTSFNTYNKDRTKNIFLASASINNFVVFPGERFSFNQAVGQRTAGKGYMPAPVIIKGELAEDIGGGICQVSSTLFNAVDNAGLKVIKRSSHSMKVSYIPPGRDATVSWNGPDFVFENKYNQPILIQAKMVGNQLTIEILSSEVIKYSSKAVPTLPPNQDHPPK